MRGRRKISLSGRCRCDLHIGCLLWTKTVAQRVENLALAVLACARLGIRRKVLGPRSKARLCARSHVAWAYLELLNRADDSAQPCSRRRIVISTMAIGARMCQNDLTAPQNLIL